MGENRDHIRRKYMNKGCCVYKIPLVSEKEQKCGILMPSLAKDGVLACLLDNSDIS